MSAFGAAIFGCEGQRLSAQEAAFFASVRPFGFILFTRNCEEADQIRKLCADLRGAVGYDAPVFIDQEGGRVQRMRPPLMRDWRPPLDDAALYGAHSVQAFHLRAHIIALELRALGIDGNCIPTLDIARPDTHAVLRNRCYGTSRDQVIAHGRAVYEGTRAAGCLPVIKHMPGHGRATLDSHLALPVVQASRGALEAEDFAVFRAFQDVPLGMSAHQVFQDIDPRPATLSPVMVHLIRQEIGFQGLLMTDDISMQALDGTPSERSVAALKAGCDLVLHCNGDLAEMESIAAAVGSLSRDGQTRADAALAARRVPETVDISALDAEFQALPRAA